MFIIVVCILIYIYIKLTYTFWTLQPVFHIYDIGYFLHLYKFGIIQPNAPQLNRFTDLVHIKSKQFDELDDESIDILVKFISTHYLQNGDNKYIPLRENIVPYFENHHSKSIVSIYKNNPFAKINAPNNLQSIITSRPVTVQFLADSNLNLNAQYVDFLCVARGNRNKGIAPKMIQSHYYNQYEMVGAETGLVCVFKREGVLTGIVPLCAYTSYAYFGVLSHIPFVSCPKIQEKYGGYNLVRITVSNMYKLHEFLNNCLKEKMFSIAVQTAESNLCELVKTKNIFIDIVVAQNQIRGAYFFRETSTFTSKNSRVLSCIGSIKCVDTLLDIFIIGFNNSIKILMDEIPNCAVLDVEDISHNHYLISNLNKYCTPDKSPTAYFFYNYAYPTISSNQAFIIT
jgi:hypothetical protein